MTPMYIIDLELHRPNFRPVLTKENHANEKSKEILVLTTLKTKKVRQNPSKFQKTSKSFKCKQKLKLI